MFWLVCYCSFSWSGSNIIGIYDHMISSLLLMLALPVTAIACFSLNWCCFGLRELYCFYLSFRLLRVSWVLVLVSFALTFFTLSLISASDHNTVSILCRPPFISITMNKSCASTMSPSRNTCGLHRSYLWIVCQCHGFLFCSEFSLEHEVLKPFFLAGIFGCPTMQKFREFVAAIASLLLFVVVCLSLSGVSFIYFLRQACVTATKCAVTSRL